MFPNIDITIPGWTSEFDLLCLAWLARSVPAYSHIVEIGSLFGSTTSAIANNRRSGTWMTAVDRFEDLPTGTDLDQWAASMFGNSSTVRDFMASAPEPKNWKSIFDQYIGARENFIAKQGFSQEYTAPANTRLAFIDGNHEGRQPFDDIMLFINMNECLIVIDDCNVDEFPDVICALHRSKTVSKRRIYSPGNSRMTLLIPPHGPMRDAASQFITLTMYHDNPMDLRNAMGNPYWWPK
jgi:hypothetical protein